jgi:integrase
MTIREGTAGLVRLRKVALSQLAKPIPLGHSSFTLCPLLSVERFRAQEHAFLAMAPESLKSVSIILLDTGLRMRELLTLDWSDVRLTAPAGATFGYLTVRSGKSKNSKSRNVPLSQRANQVWPILLCCCRIGQQLRF